MEKIYKIFVINNETYLVEDEIVEIGDKAIVTVNDLYPTLIECKNDEQIKLIQEPKTSMTKRYKVKESAEKLDLTDEILFALDNT
jgi:hypothetical protein